MEVMYYLQLAANVSSPDQTYTFKVLYVRDTLLDYLLDNNTAT